MSSSGVVIDTENHNGDSAFTYWNGFSLRYDTIADGIKNKPFLDSHFLRFHENLEQNADLLATTSDHKLYETRSVEREKLFSPKPGSTVGTTTKILTADTDEKYLHYDF